MKSYSLISWYFNKLYLLRKFAEGSGQSVGEFYTTRKVGIFMARLLDAEEGEEVYDPACGLLTRRVLKEKKQEDVKTSQKLKFL